MASEMELLPCPFCNSDDVMVLDVEPTGQMSEYSHVHCANCLANGPMKQSDKQAATAWNTRPVPAPVGVKADREAIVDVLSAELDDAYDCTRVWSAWGYGTMTEDDFQPASNRADEIADAILSALTSPQTCEAGE